MKILLTALIGFASILLPVSAQAESTPPKPSGTLFHRRAPEFSRWSVTYNPSASKTGGATGTFSRKVVVTKTKTIMLEQTFAPNGTKHEKWRIGDLQFSRRSQEEPYRYYTKDSSSTGRLSERVYTDYSVTDFPGFEWVSDQNYAGIRKVANKECIVFSQTPSNGNEEAATAYIDLATRYPVVLTKGKETRLYEFHPAPQAVLPLPTEVQQYFDQRAQTQRAERQP